MRAELAVDMIRMWCEDAFVLAQRSILKSAAFSMAMPLVSCAPPQLTLACLIAQGEESLD
ncbi:hypothetical protein XH96_33375 [Bradyrhizobium sp. CCBAU 51765]|nr:hypothetical protein XH96_33375 [Bradyrhizobium sp. CCBAU 51765]